MPVTKGTGPWLGHNADVAQRPVETRLNREQVAILAAAMSEQYFQMLRLSPSLIQHTLLVMLISTQARYKGHPWKLSTLADATGQSIKHVRDNVRWLAAAGYLEVRKQGRARVLIPNPDSIDIIIERGRWDQRVKRMRETLARIDAAASMHVPEPAEMVAEMLGDEVGE